MALQRKALLKSTDDLLRRNLSKGRMSLPTVIPKQFRCKCGDEVDRGAARTGLKSSPHTSRVPILGEQQPFATWAHSSQAVPLTSVHHRMQRIGKEEEGVGVPLSPTLILRVLGICVTLSHPENRSINSRKRGQKAGGNSAMLIN